MEEVIDIWDDSAITVSEDDLTINPIVLEPLEISTVLEIVD